MIFNRPRAKAKPTTADVTLLGTFSTVESVPNNCCVVIDGTTYVTPQTITVPIGTAITVHVRGNSAANTYIKFNGTKVASGANTKPSGHSYTFNVTTRTAIEGYYGSTGPYYMGHISITMPWDGSTNS
jgi:hypothetical protein|nr:MAG TPA: hypothetical protein [Caudoviricetes sp.]